MRKYIFVLIVFSLVLFCHSQEKNSITTGNLKGKVKTLKETIKFFLMKEEMWWKMNNIILKEKFF